ARTVFLPTRSVFLPARSVFRKARIVFRRAHPLSGGAFRRTALIADRCRPYAGARLQILQRLDREPLHKLSPRAGARGLGGRAAPRANVFEPPRPQAPRSRSG